jgi:Fe2+ or Zn2+ uptake regulation protein
MENYFETVTQAVTSLKKEGYVLDFNLMGECLVCEHTNTELSPEEFEIDNVFRFEGETDPADEMILFAVSSSKFKVKGLLLNAYGIYADSASDQMISKLKMHTTHNL